MIKNRIASMKTSIFSLFALFFLITTATTQGQSSFQGDVMTIVVNFDAACMKKYEYQTDENYIVEENYTNYHLPINSEKTLILKTLNSAASLTKINASNYQTLACSNGVDIGEDFVRRVNNGATNIILKIPTTKGYELKPVEYTILQTMTDGEMIYFAAPYMSFVYHYDIQHNPGEALRSGELKDGEKYIMRHFQYGESEEQGIRNDIFLKMYDDACSNRAFGVTTPLSPKGQSNPYLNATHSASGQKLYRSCQHPIRSEYLKGIGLYKEYYEEGSTMYSSKLVAIDNMPIEKYLSLMSPNYKQKKENKVEAITDYSFMGQAVAFKGGEVEKTITAVEKAAISNNIPGKGAVKMDNYIFKSGKTDLPTEVVTESIKVEQVIRQPRSKGINIARSQDIAGNVHVVAKGETLYSLSRKYSTTIDRLKALNNLPDNTILTNQKLVIRAN